MMNPNEYSASDLNPTPPLDFDKSETPASKKELKLLARLLSFMIYVILNGPRVALQGVFYDYTSVTSLALDSERQGLTDYCSKVITAVGWKWSFQMAQSTVYLTLVYVILLVRARVELDSAKDIFLVAFILAHKYIHDHTYDASTWQYLSKHSGQDLLNMELRSLKSLDYNVFVDDIKFLHWCRLLDECFYRPKDTLCAAKNIGKLVEQVAGWKHAHESEGARWQAQESVRRTEREQRDLNQANIQAILRLLEAHSEKQKFRQQLLKVQSEKERIREQLVKIEQEERKIRGCLSKNASDNARYPPYAHQPSGQATYHSNWPPTPIEPQQNHQPLWRYTMSEHRLTWPYSLFGPTQPHQPSQQSVLSYKLPTPASSGQRTNCKLSPVGCSTNARVHNGEPWNPISGSSFDIVTCGFSSFTRLV